MTVSLKLVRPLRVKTYNGMIFNDFVDFPVVKHEHAISVDEKIVAAGPLSLQVHKEAYKYQPELLLSTWSLTYPVIESRGVHDSNYWRSELILSQLSDHKKIRELRDASMKAAYICTAILEGVI